jgi:hypothetical protein
MLQAQFEHIHRVIEIGYEFRRFARSYSNKTSYNNSKAQVRQIENWGSNSPEDEYRSENYLGLLLNVFLACARFSS